MRLVDDLAHGWRQLRATPWFSLTALLSLALGLAATSTAASVVLALVTPATGIRDAGRVVDIGRATDGAGFDNMSHPALEYVRSHSTTFTGIAGMDFASRPITVQLGDSSERAFGALVSANFFDVLGTRATRGRFFRADEDTAPGAHPVAVITHRFWTTRLGGDPAVLDRPLRVNGREFTVVGVAEPGFEGPSFVGTDLWLPMAMVAEARGLADTRLLTDPRAVWHIGIGRLAPGVSRRQAEAELNTLVAQFKAATPEAPARHTIATVATSRIPGPMRTPFLLFVGVLSCLALALLAIACSNVAGLLLARASVRRREMATRLALGASRGQLLVQLLTETVLLFALAGVMAVPLTLAGVRLLDASLPALPVALALDLQVNGQVVLFAGLTAFVTALAFGLAPARHALGADVAPLLLGGTATLDRHRARLRQALVVIQVALSLMLVVTAGLFVRSLQQAGRIDPGFRVAGIVLANVDVELSGYRGDRAVALIERMQQRLAALGGVHSVAAARVIPLQGSGFGLGRLRVPGLQGPDSSDVVDADWNVVSPGYFDTVGLQVVEGRTLEAGDRAGAASVVVVNEAFAQRAWPGRPAVGQRVLHGDRDGHEVALEVVGVAANAAARYLSDAPTPFVFVPLAQHPVGDVTFFVRHRPGADLSAALRGALRQEAPEVPVLFVQSFEDAVAFGLLPQRLTAWVAGSIGIVGAGLAALGLYGLMAFLVAQRTREIAIRMALGATTWQTQSLVLSQAARLAVTGAILGGGLAAGVGTLLRALLVGVPVLDWVSYGGTAALAALVLGVAAWLPARRAAATPAAAALRAD